MSFAGLPKGSERADVIAYLNSKSDNPQPLPKAADAARRAEGGGSACRPEESSDIAARHFWLVRRFAQATVDRLRILNAERC